MRVAIVTESFVPQVNGVSNTVRHLVRELVAAGHEPVVAAPGPGPAEHDGVRVVRVRSVGLPDAVGQQRLLAERARLPRRGAVRPPPAGAADVGAVRFVGPRRYQDRRSTLLSGMNPASINPVIALQNAWETPDLEQRRSRRVVRSRRRVRTSIASRLNTSTPPLEM